MYIYTNTDVGNEIEPVALKAKLSWVAPMSSKPKLAEMLLVVLDNTYNKIYVWLKKCNEG